MLNLLKRGIVDSKQKVIHWSFGRLMGFARPCPSDLGLRKPSDGQSPYSMHYKVSAPAVKKTLAQSLFKRDYSSIG